MTFKIGYKITNTYHWYKIPKENPILSKVYYIEGIPFDLDYIEQKNVSQEILDIADSNIKINPEYIFRKSEYLISEMAHPLLFDLDIENPEEMPADY